VIQEPASEGEQMAFDGFRWLNEPKSWSAERGQLSLTTDGHTDFWQKTFYGFERDSGHAYLKPVSGDFAATVTFHGKYETLYDQAGLMLRVDAQHWVKTGIECTDGLMHFSVVLTNPQSDWSVIPLPEATPQDAVRVSLSRHAEALHIRYAVGSRPWKLARLAPFSAADAEVGVMACSPERAGFEATFSDIEIGAAGEKKLHAD